MYPANGHDENDIHLFFESGVPFFAKRFSKATAGTQIDTWGYKILVSVNKINFVPQSVQDCNLPVTRCRGNGILRNCPPPAGAQRNRQCQYYQDMMPISHD